MRKRIKEMLCVLLLGALFLGAVACIPAPDQPVLDSTEASATPLEPEQTQHETTELLEEAIPPSRERAAGIICVLNPEKTSFTK